MAEDHPTKPGSRAQHEQFFLEAIRDGEFEVDRQGRIWRLFKTRSGRIYPCARRRAERRNTHGYMQLSKGLNGRKGLYRTAMAHRIVWLSLVGPIPPELEINHINGVKSDNRIENLELMTHRENCKYTFAAGFHTMGGEKHPTAKLTDAQVEQARIEFAKGEYTRKQLAAKFGVAYITMVQILNGHSRAKQGGPVTRPSA